MDLMEIGLGGVDWIRLAQDRDRWRAVVSAVMNLRVLAPRSELVRRKNGRFCEEPKCELGGRLKDEIHILFPGDIS
jgi:hypothetical protein